MMPAGSINAWECPVCGHLTVAVHVDEGVTPMFLGCRRKPGCTGRAVSSGYPSLPVPERIRLLCAWEWFRPSATQMKRYRREDPAMFQHCAQGGLELRPLTDAGRRAIGAAA